MMTQEQVLNAVKAGRGSRCIDERDYHRLLLFFPVKEWEVFGAKLKDGVSAPIVKAWTLEEILKQLSEDVAFGFEKALDRRGISSDAMHEVVKMWMWILEDPLQYQDDYMYYGLPLFKAVAVKYGLTNPIGDDCGDEDKYA